MSTPPTTGNTQAAAKTATAAKRSRRVSPGGSKQTQQFSALTKAYAVLSMIDKSSWVVLVQSVNTSAGLTGRRKLSAANLYTKVNTVRLALSLPLLSTAPSALPPAPPLPDSIRVKTALQSGFSCAVYSQQVYSGYMQVQAAPPAPAGNNSYDPQSFRVIGTLNGLGVGSNYVTSQYVAKYGAPTLGTEIALRLVPMDALGDRLAGRVITGVVLASASEDEIGGDDTAEAATLLRAA